MLEKLDEEDNRMDLHFFLIALPRGSGEVRNKEFKDSLTGMEFVFVAGGCYPMGDNFGNGNADEEPVHETCVSDFYIGAYEVTQGQWEKVMGNNPSRFGKGRKYPVEYLSWYEVQEFIRKLNKKTGMNYRLPTEAEWEYAARSRGKKEKWAGTSRAANLHEFAWYDKNSDGQSHPVGEKNLMISGYSICQGMSGNG